MKYLITESRLEGIIRDYLDGHYYPDYNWAEKEFYKGDVERFGHYEFNIDDDSAYVYLLKKDKYSKVPPKTLIVQPYVGEKLTDLFGNAWEPVFVKWFEDNTGLPVEHISVQWR
jgi:hypothetical protein